MSKPTPNKKTETKKADTTQPAGSGNLKGIGLGILVLLAYLMVYNINTQSSDTEDKPTTPEAPSFDASAWFSGVYQDKYEDYLKNNSRLGSELLPLKNEIDYKVFNKINLEDFIVAKDDYFMSAHGITTYYGRNYLGDSAIKEKLRKVKVIQDTLKRKGIDVVLLLVPNKEYMLPEYFPDAYRKYKREPKNDYDAYVAECKAQGLHAIDFYSFFMKLKPTSPYPLYPQHGTHWSFYSECLMADTVIKYLENLEQVTLPHITWSNIVYPSEAKVRDADGAQKAKLLYPPKDIPLAYPQVEYMGAPNARPIKVLGIGDSYYRAFMYLGVMQNVFDNGEFWYYYNSVLPESDTKLKEVWESDLKTKIEENKVILILCSSSNFWNFGYGFIEDAYQLYTDPQAYNARVKKERPIKANKKQIHQDPDLLDEATKMAKESGITLDSAITLKAEGMGHQ